MAWSRGTGRSAPNRMLVILVIARTPKAERMVGFAVCPMVYVTSMKLGTDRKQQQGFCLAMSITKEMVNGCWLQVRRRVQFCSLFSRKLSCLPRA